MLSVRNFVRWLSPKAPNVFVFWLLSVPLLFALASFAESLLPDRFYYPVTIYFGFFGVTPFLPVVLFLGWVQWNDLCGRIERIKKPWRSVLKGFLTIVMVLLFLYGLLAAFFGTDSQRFNVGHTYCQSPFIEGVMRCEGWDFGLWQDRLSAVAIYGSKFPDFEYAISASEYQLKEVSCSKLAGQFGDLCYSGSLSRSTGDTNFMSVYTHQNKVLVVLTENVPLYADGHPWILTKFLDIERFRKEMSQ